MTAPIFATGPFVAPGATEASPGSQPDIFPASAYTPPAATGPVINYPSATAGFGPAAAGVAQGIQNYRDQALGKLARIHAMIDAGNLDPSVMDSPDVQALFPQAGLDYLEHKKFLPTPENVKTQTQRAEFQAPYNAPGTEGGAKIANGQPVAGPNQRMVEKAAAERLAQPGVAGYVSKVPEAGTAASLESAEGSHAALEAAGAKGALQSYNDPNNPVFRDWVQNLSAGTMPATLETLRGRYMLATADKQMKMFGAQIFGGPIMNARQDYERELAGWQAAAKDAGDKALQAALLLPNPPQTAADNQKIVNDARTAFAAKTAPPTLEGVMQTSIESTAKALGMAPSQMVDGVKGTVGLEGIGEMRYQTPEQAEFLYRIATDFKNQGYHLMPDGTKATPDQFFKSTNPLFVDNQQFMRDFLKMKGKITQHGVTATSKSSSVPKPVTTTTTAPPPITSYP